jgi:hypothetical protein
MSAEPTIQRQWGKRGWGIAALLAPPIFLGCRKFLCGHSPPATMAAAVSPPAVMTMVVITTAVVIGLRNQRVPCGCLDDRVEVCRNSRRRRDADKTQSERTDLERPQQGPRGERSREARGRHEDQTARRERHRPGSRQGAGKPSPTRPTSGSRPGMKGLTQSLWVARSASCGWRSKARRPASSEHRG